MHILLDTSPLRSGHAGRGIGTYTRSLQQALAQLPDVDLVDESDRKTKADLIHYPFFDFYFATLPLYRPAPTVVTIHDCVPLLYPDQYPAGVKGQFRFARQKLALRSVQAVITDSQAAATDIVAQLPVAGTKVFPIHLAANPALGPVSDGTFAEMHRKLKLPKKFVLYVGDINYNKNIPQLIKAMKFLPEDLNLVCVGRNFSPQDIPEWKAVETQLALSDVEKRTSFLTKIGSDVELSAVYQAAAVYVQPSLYEGFGLPVLEAMRCRTPVVATQRAALPEISDHHAVLVEPDAESLAQGIKQVLSWSARETHQRLQAAETWQEQFTWRKTAEKTLDVYRQALG